MRSRIFDRQIIYALPTLRHVWRIGRSVGRRGRAGRGWVAISVIRRGFGIGRSRRGIGACRLVVARPTIATSDQRPLEQKKMKN